MDHVGLPLDEKYFEEVDQFFDNHVIDPNQLNFEEVDDQILSGIIYIRNLQINPHFDFEKCSYEIKEKWLLTYLKADIMLDIGLIQLDASILSILANERVLPECILSNDEIKKFKDRNSEFIDEIITFLVSLNVITVILEKNKSNELIKYDFYKGKIIKEKPLFYETIKHLIFTYPTICDAIRLYFTETYESVLYEYVIKNISKEFGFYKAILLLPSVKFFALI